MHVIKAAYLVLLLVICSNKGHNTHDNSSCKMPARLLHQQNNKANLKLSMLCTFMPRQADLHVIWLKHHRSPTTCSM